MNFTRHLIVVLILIVFFLLIAGLWTTSVATTKSNTATAVQAIFGVAKDSYTVLPAENSNGVGERASFISKIRAALRDLPEPVVEEVIRMDTPVPSVPLPPEVVPEVESLPIVDPVLVPVETPAATSTRVTEMAPLPPM